MNIGLMIGSIFVPGHWVFLLWAFVFVIEESATFIHYFLLKEKIPRHIHHLGHRYGEFLIVALGEAVLQLLLNPSPFALHDLVSALLAFGFIYQLSILYFDSQPHHIEHHAVTQGGFWAFAWIQIQGALAWWFIMIGVALKILWEHRKFGEGPGPQNLNSEAWFLSGSVSMSMFSMVVIRFTHKGIAMRPKRMLTYLLRLLAAAWVLITPLIDESPYVLLPLIFVGVAANVVIDSVSSQRSLRVLHRRNSKHTSQKEVTTVATTPISEASSDKSHSAAIEV